MAKDENGNEIVVETPVETLAEEPSVEVALEDEMDDLFDDEVTTKEEPPAEDPPSEDPPAEKKPPGEEPATPSLEDPPAEDPPSEDPPAEDPPASDENPPADDELTRLKTQNEKLLKLIEDGAVPKVEEPEMPAKETPAETLPETTAPPEQVEGMEEYLKGIDFDKVMESKEEFVKFMLKVTSGVQERTKQSVLTSIPNIVGTFVQQKASMDTMANAFYKEFPLLKRSKKYVSIIANEISAESPEMKIDEVMKETGKRAMEALGLTNVVQKQEKKKETKPKVQLPGNISTKNPPAPPKGLADEMEDLFED